MYVCGEMFMKFLVMNINNSSVEQFRVAYQW